MLGTGCRIKVYGDPHEPLVVARVRANTLLDRWDGSNWGSGRPGMHKGITQLRDGRWVILHVAGCHGLRSYGSIVSAEDALAEILASGNTCLLERKRFKALRNQ